MLSNLHAVSRERHGSLRWHPCKSYNFARSTASVPLVPLEMSAAAISLPVAFIREADQYRLIAMLGIQPDKNVYVARDGSWLATYIPALLRCAPFKIATSEHGTRVLCVDEAIGMVGDVPTGELFFDEQGEPAAELAKIIVFLQKIEGDLGNTVKICNELERLALIQPWPITIQTRNGNITIDGLFRIDETRLNSCNGDELHVLRDSGALALAYCQLISQQHLAMLGTLADAHAKYQETSAMPTNGGELDLSFLSGVKLQ